MTGFVAPDMLGLILSTEVIMWVATGGRGLILGAIVGTIVVSELQQRISSVDTKLWPMFMGLFFIAMVFLFPDGLLSVVWRVGALWRRDRANGEVVNDASLLHAIPLAVLEASRSTMFRSTSLKERLTASWVQTARAKSTLLNMVCGTITPSSGRILFEQRDIVGLTKRRIARLGIARKFQAPSVLARDSAPESGGRCRRTRWGG